MPEKNPENLSNNPEIQPVPEQGREFLDSMHADSVQEQARRFYKERPDSNLADKTAEIIQFPSGKKVETPLTETQEADFSPEDSELLRVNPKGWLSKYIGKKVEDPYSAVQGLAEISDQENNKAA